MKPIHKIKEKIALALGNKLYRISAYSIASVLMGFIGLYGGIWLDRITGMMPLLTIVGLITGIALGFLGLIYEIKGDMKD